MTLSDFLWLLTTALLTAVVVLERLIQRGQREIVQMHRQVQEDSERLIESSRKLLDHPTYSIKVIVEEVAYEHHRFLMVAEMDPDHGPNQKEYYDQGWARCSDCVGQPLEVWQRNCSSRLCGQEKMANMAVSLDARIP